MTTRMLNERKQDVKKVGCKRMEKECDSHDGQAVVFDRHFIFLLTALWRALKMFNIWRRVEVAVRLG